MIRCLSGMSPFRQPAPRGFGLLRFGRYFLHPLRADPAIGELNQLADNQIAAPTVDGNPRCHKETSACDFRYRGNIRAVVEVESFADDIFIRRVRRVGGFRPKPREAANDVIELAPAEEECAVASGREARTDTVPAAVDRFRFPNAVRTSVRHHSQFAAWVGIDAWVLAGVEHDARLLEVREAVLADGVGRASGDTGRRGPPEFARASVLV